MVVLILMMILRSVIAGSSVICRGPCQPMPPCDHEEADTRIGVHLRDATEKGARIRTVDTDVMLKNTEIFFSSKACFQTWIFGWHLLWETIFQYHHKNAICQSLDEGNYQGLPFYHAYTSCNTTSQSLGEEKKSSWGTWKWNSSVTGALDSTSSVFESLECFKCVLHEKLH